MDPTNQPTDTARYRGALAHLKKYRHRKYKEKKLKSDEKEEER